MSHPSLRSTLVPLASGLAAVIAVCGLCGATPAFGADSVRAQEWWLTGLHVTQAWPTTQGSGVTVAVLSTGVAASHPDLAGSVITGPDYTGSGRTPGGAFWGVDGTGVASLIAGHGHGSGDASGIIGVAPAAKVLSIRVTLEFNDPLNSDAAVARLLPAAIASGITYAVDHGARVIDLPLDPGTFGLTGDGDPAAAGGSAAERSAVAAAVRKGVILVAPAGDDGQGPGIVNYPAGYPGVIAVGAVDRNGRLAAFSSRRTQVTLTAPGVGLVAATPPDGYQAISSTSTASGIVAAVAALIVSRFPRLSAAQVTQALTKSTVATAAASPPTAGAVVAGSASAPGTGHGTVNAARAVELAAAISSAGQVRQTATPTATPPKPPRAAAAPHRVNAGTLAGSLVRDAVAVLGVLIALLVVLLLIMNSRRRKAVTAARSRTGHTPGAHAHRRPERAARPGAAGRPAPAQPTTPAASGWPAPGGWQGGSIIGEIVPSSPPSSRPAMTPAPKTAPSRSSRGAAGQRGSANPASPPWAPAAEPERTTGLPMAAANWFSPEPGPGIRVPADMTAPPAPAGFEVTAPQPALGFTAPAERDMPGPATVPGFPALGSIPDFASTPATGSEVLTQPDMGFAAAPVATDASAVWDLAATDVFPVAPPEPGNDDAPGASQS